VVIANAGCGDRQAGDTEQEPDDVRSVPAVAGGRVVELAPDTPVVVLETSMGEITIGLDPGDSPESVANFLAYVRDGFYDGLAFHRVIRGFMVQTGGFDANLQPRAPTRAPIPNESDNRLGNRRGTVAMARTADPHSASAQFYINQVDNPALDYEARGPRQWGYAVFGKVLEGMDVVDRIAATPTAASGGMMDVPVKPIVIERAYVRGSRP